MKRFFSLHLGISLHLGEQWQVGGQEQARQRKSEPEMRFKFLSWKVKVKRDREVTWIWLCGFGSGELLQQLMEHFRHPVKNPAQGFLGQPVPWLDHTAHQQPKAQEMWWFSTKPICLKVVFHSPKSRNLQPLCFLFWEYQRNGGFLFHQQMYVSDSYTSIFPCWPKHQTLQIAQARSTIRLFPNNIPLITFEKIMGCKWCVLVTLTHSTIQLYSWNVFIRSN